ncbi:MAG: tRNA-dihydrouridine synthase family protein, partial [Candidatus Micrarchaeota archaeon]|nr:tRNA-dihydrouridine synthase family protein [Candidatus Micrarchaeota archaeon]
PMAAYTDIAFRLLCRRAGASMCFTEFANANAIVRGGENTLALMRTCKEEAPTGIQIFGADASSMADACRKINSLVETGELFASSIDLNFGCPAGSVIRAGAGSALLRNPKKMAEIASACSKASELPITAKIRAGWRNNEAVELAKMLQEAGVAGIAVHWRTATEGRKRQEGWSALQGVVEAVEIPVIGNGGANTPSRAVQFLQQSGCAAVMIASGALGNPSIFSQANALLDGKEAAPLSWNEKRKSFMEYVRLAKENGISSPKRMRAHAIEWVSGFNGVKKARTKLNAAKNVDDAVKILEEFEPDSHSLSSDKKM